MIFNIPLSGDLGPETLVQKRTNCLEEVTKNKGLKNIAAQVTQNIIPSGGRGTFSPQITFDNTDNLT